jgi:CTP synthase (UTP-ammonia lyase)
MFYPAVQNTVRGGFRFRRSGRSPDCSGGRVMKRDFKIAIIGDFDSQVTAHRAIPRALELAVSATGLSVTWEWLATDAVVCTDLGQFDGFWLTPGSPYRSTEGALSVARHARENRVPFLGTCGGFQHALLEISRNVAGLREAAHAELRPDAELPLIAPLACSLVEVRGPVRFALGSQLSAAYCELEAEEGYHCRYGLNPRFADLLRRAGVFFTAFDAADEVRAFELPGHPFFVGTLFQSERRALAGQPVPIVNAFVRAVAHVTV